MEFFVTSTTELCNKDNIRDLIVKNLFSEESLMFLLEDSKASLFKNITTNISKLINSLRSNLCVVIEPIMLIKIIEIHTIDIIQQN